MSKVGCVILSAGEGTRMKSEVPKMLFTICGKTIIEHVLDTVLKLEEIEKIYVVVGYKKDLIKSKITTSLSKKSLSKIVFVTQPKQLGSGDAVLKTKNFVSKNITSLLVISGDVPLITKDTLKKLIETQKSSNVDSCVLSVEVPEPFSYGRIVRDSFGNFEKIVEEKDASLQEKSINEINSGIYVFKLPVLWENLKKITPENKKREYYLTDVIKYSNTKTTFKIKNYLEVKGINTRADLAEVENVVREKLLYNLMLEGVSIYLPQTVYIDYFTKVGPESVIYPNTILKNSLIKENCVLGPCSSIENSFVDKNTKIIYSFITDSRIGKNCKIGPFSRLRPGTKIFDDVSIGNFVEIKNSVVKQGCKINHLSYIGDTNLEQEVNIGAGTITCNYDGKTKHRTFIGKKSFIGSNTNLIAPLKIGNNVVIAAGSTISKDVAPYTLAIERSTEVHKKNHRIIKELYK